MTVTTQQLAFVFPGQGSQSVGMLQDLAANHEAVRETFNSASELLGRDLWQIVSGPEETLNQTVNTQPIMLAAGVAVWRVWSQSVPVKPAYMAGHSLGEYTALVCSGALSFEEAIPLVQFRAEAMQSAVPQGNGAMAAILGLDDAELERICQAQQSTGVVEPVNFNAPGQTVIAGEKQAVSQVVEQAKAAGAKRAILLPVSVPSHCSLMKQAAAELSARLGKIDFDQPQVPVLHNVDFQTHAAADEIREVLARQLYSPVKWVDTTEAMTAAGVTHFVEMGNGKVLSGLIKRINRQATVVSVYDNESLQKALEIFE